MTEMDSSSQIYSATYSNVPVFEFVTEEGPIMRRKSDSWINATHILKIAKFPKARRTRILEKDVQTGIHEKVQGGYGKYQGTYVPLELGAEIAKGFNVYEILKPIFDFQYIEGESITPPPAPKHNHASASNVARRQLQQQKQQKHVSVYSEDTDMDPRDSFSLKRLRLETLDSGEDPGSKRKGRPKRVTLGGRGRPSLGRDETIKIESSNVQANGPTIGTFSSRRDSINSQLAPLIRQDTDRDALLVLASTMNVRREDLEAESSEDERKDLTDSHFKTADYEEEELGSERELFGSNDFGTFRNSFEKAVLLRSKISSRSLPRLLSLNGSLNGESYGLLQGHHQNQNEIHSSSLRGDQESIEYFNTLLNFFLEDLKNGYDEGSGPSKKQLTGLDLPEKILSPPQPLEKIQINQPIDNEGNTIFHWACSMANRSMIEFLLTMFSKFIDGKVKNYHGETPLMFLVQFNNSYQMKNFDKIFDTLFDSVLAVDNNGRTLLHHIALASYSTGNGSARNPGDMTLHAKKERYSKYYFDIVFSKLVEFTNFQIHLGDENRSPEEKEKIVSEFINHQDKEGNSALHIISYHLSKKSIKTFIKYHRFIDFGLRNNVHYSVEDYLASHNYVLRLEDDNNKSLVANGDTESKMAIYADEATQSFDTHLHKTKVALGLQDSTSNIVTEKLGELSYAMGEELNEKDEKLLSLYRYQKILGLDKFASQRKILDLFDLGYLVEEFSKEYADMEDSLEESRMNIKVIDLSKDTIIQDEINRLINDVCFQTLTTSEEFQNSLALYTRLREKFMRNKLTELEKSYKHKLSDTKPFDLAIKLQREVIRRKTLSKELYSKEPDIPLFAQFPDESKENYDHANDTGIDTEKSGSRILNYPPTDKLHKYCKLIALSCGMSFKEVESSIDLIEKSLAKSLNN